MTTADADQPSARQLLHWVFKVGNLKRALDFHRRVLGLRVLRHEEFQSGCEAQCNGAYARPWSKTMVGQGAEDAHFVFELTFNYGVREYARGNDLQCVLLSASNPGAVLRRARDLGYRCDGATIFCPDGYAYQLQNIETDFDPIADDQRTNDGRDADYQVTVLGVRLNVTRMDACCRFYQYVIGLPMLAKPLATPETGAARAVFGDLSTGMRLELEQVMCASIQHAEAYGRLAIAVPTAQLAAIQEAVESEQKTIGCAVHTPLIRLETPGKADVQVVISLDPEGYEVCTVGSEGFFELCQLFPGADRIDWEQRREMGDIVD